MADSTQAGALTPPALPPPLLGLSAAVQRMVVGASGLPGTRVIPAWPSQANAPPRPKIDVDWCGIMLQTITPEGTAHMRQLDALVTRGTIWLRYEFLFSFYGPNGYAYGMRAWTGLQFSQNTSDLLAAADARVQGVETLRNVGEQIGQLFYDRADLPVTISQRVRADYPIRSLLDAVVNIPDAGLPPFNVL